MVSKASAYYLWPLVLVDDAGDMAEDSPGLEQEVFRKVLRHGISVKVLHEGVFVFDFSNWPEENSFQAGPCYDFDVNVERVVRRVSVMNAYLACFYTAFYRLQHVTTHLMRVHPSSLLQFASLDDPSLEQIVVGCPDAFIRAVRTDPNWRLMKRYVVVTMPVIESSLQQLELVLDEDSTDALILADMYLRSCLACGEHDYNLSLVVAWTIIEKLLNLNWSRYIDEHREHEVEGGRRVPIISKERRKKLMTGRDFSASVIIEVLSLDGRIPFSLYDDLAKVRQARNAWMHDLKPVSRETARRAISVAEQMVSFTLKIDLQISFATGIPG